MRILQYSAIAVVMLMFMVLGGQIADFGPTDAVLTTMVLPDLADSAEPLPLALQKLNLHALQEPNSASDHLNSDNRWIITAKLDNLLADVHEPAMASINFGATVLDPLTAMRRDTSVPPAARTGAATALTPIGVLDKTIEVARAIAFNF